MSERRKAIRALFLATIIVVSTMAIGAGGTAGAATKASADANTATPAVLTAPTYSQTNGSATQEENGTTTQSENGPSVDTDAVVAQARAADTVIGSQLTIQVRTKERALEQGPESVPGVSTQSEQELRTQQIVIHTSGPLRDRQLNRLRDNGVEIRADSYIPDEDGGSYYAVAPVDELDRIVTLDGVTRVATAENTAQLSNDVSTPIIRSNATNDAEVDNQSLTGEGVRVAVIDTGVDTSHNAIQNAVVASNESYVSGPGTDQNGHGTHIAGTIASSDDQYSGVSPDAEIIDLDVQDNGNTGDIASAVVDAVDRYNADVISLSWGFRGGESAHRTGESRIADAVNYAAAQGAVVAVSAGNAGNDRHHARATVPANSEMSITLDVTGSGRGAFTLVREHPNRLDMTLVEDGTELQPQNNRQLAVDDDVRQDPKGYWDDMLTYGDFDQNRRYTLQVENTENHPVTFDLYYQAYLSADISFVDNRSRMRTITDPATAEGAIAVGSYTSRDQWTDVNGNTHSYDQNGTLTAFSSRGPTIDGRTKPDVVAPGSLIVSAASGEAGYRPRFRITEEGATGSEDDWVGKLGTSMAAPHVAGEAALLIQQYRAITGRAPPQTLTRTLITQGTTPLNDPTRLRSHIDNQTGAGLINTHYAYLAYGVADRTATPASIQVGVPEDAAASPMPQKATGLVNQSTQLQGSAFGTGYDAVSTANYNLSLKGSTAPETKTKATIAVAATPGESQQARLTTSMSDAPVVGLATTYPPVADATLNTTTVTGYENRTVGSLAPGVTAAYAVPVGQTNERTGQFVTQHGGLRAYGYWNTRAADIDARIVHQNGTVLAASPADPGLPATQAITSVDPGGYKVTYTASGTSTPLTSAVNYPYEPLPSEAAIEADDLSAGSATDPGQIGFNVTIQTANLPYRYRPFDSPDASHFEVTVGSKQVASSDITLRPVNNRQDKYHLRMPAPSQPANGTYDLTVNFTDTKYGVSHTATTTEENAVGYSPGGSSGAAAIAVIIDGSGSMGDGPGSQLRAAKRASEILVKDQLLATDEAATVGYGRTAAVLRTMRPVGGNRSTFNTSIYNVETQVDRGATNIGAALILGRDQLNQSSNGTTKAAILLTDGQNNVGYSDQEVRGVIAPTYAREGYDIYTIGYGSFADTALLKDVANDTDGRYYKAANATQLRRIYRDIRSTTSGSATISSTSGSVPANGQISNTVPLDASTDTAIFSIATSSGSGSSSAAPAAQSGTTVRLRYPNGTLVGLDPNTSSGTVDPNIIYAQTAGTTTYRLQDPTPGNWTYEIQNSQSQTVDYSSQVTASTNTTLSVATNGQQFTNGSLVRLTATILSGTGGVSGATVTANVTTPTQQRTVTLTEQSAGTYTATLTVTDPGSYAADVTAESGNIVRTQSVSWSVVDQSSLLNVSSTSPTPDVKQGGKGTVAINVTRPTSGSSTSDSTALISGTERNASYSDFDSRARDLAGLSREEIRQANVSEALKKAALTIKNASQASENASGAEVRSAQPSAGGSTKRVYIQSTTLSGPGTNTIQSGRVIVGQGVVRLASGESQRVEVTVNVPNGVETGTYRGDIRFVVDGTVFQQEISVNVTEATTKTYVNRIDTAASKWKRASPAGKRVYEKRIADHLTQIYFNTGGVNGSSANAAAATEAQQSRSQRLTAPQHRAFQAAPAVDRGVMEGIA